MLNPKLKPFSLLIGEWKTIGTHPLLPGKILHGHVSFKWSEDGAFLLMHSEVEGDDVPAAVAILGSDDSSEVASMLYFDERGVSRIYQTTLTGNIWKFWRNAPGFSQRSTGTFADNDNTIQVIGELSRDDLSWENDLAQTYMRIT